MRITSFPRAATFCQGCKTCQLYRKYRNAYGSADENWVSRYVISSKPNLNYIVMSRWTHLRVRSRVARSHARASATSVPPTLFMRQPCPLLVGHAHPLAGASKQGAAVSNAGSQGQGVQAAAAGRANGAHVQVVHRQGGQGGRRCRCRWGRGHLNTTPADIYDMRVGVACQRPVGGLLDLEMFTRLLVVDRLCRAGLGVLVQDHIPRAHGKPVPPHCPHRARRAGPPLVGCQAGQAWRGGGCLGAIEVMPGWQIQPARFPPVQEVAPRLR